MNEVSYVISEPEREAVISCIARAVHPTLTFVAVNDVLKMLQSLEPSEDKKEE